MSLANLITSCTLSCLYIACASSLNNGDAIRRSRIDHLPERHPPPVLSGARLTLRLIVDNTPTSKGIAVEHLSGTAADLVKVVTPTLSFAYASCVNRESFPDQHVPTLRSAVFSLAVLSDGQECKRKAESHPKESRPRRGRIDRTCDDDSRRIQGDVAAAEVKYYAECQRFKFNRRNMQCAWHCQQGYK
jgi:hypothetical protein